MEAIEWLQSKITAPVVASESVERPRLLDTLEYSRLKKITVVRAPAGYGKTTLLGQMINRLDEQVAWLSLDASDNNPVHFWGYVVHALSHAEKDGEATVMSEVKMYSPLELLIDTFLNEISRLKGKFLLVLDDYHLIENPLIHSMMVRFIEYLPDNVRLLITSRADLPLPLARWRVQETLYEIGVDQLRFTQKEVEDFCEKRNSGYGDEESIVRLFEITEGWAAGVQLACLSGGMETIDQVATGTVDGNFPFITEFLLQEILEKLSTDEQDFLVRTSILKHMEPAICDALTDRNDSHTVLMGFEKKGLFIVRLNAGEPAFRYHHLFQDALRIEMHKRYAQHEIDSFYKNVSGILLDRGDIVLAIELALRGKLWALADQIILTHLVDIFAMEHISTFVRWIEILRSHHFVVHAESLVMYMIALSNQYEMEKAKRLIDELESRHKMDRWMEKKEYAGVASIFQTAKAFVIFASGGDINQAKELIASQLQNGRTSSRWDHIPMRYNQLEARTLRTSIGGRGKLWPKEVVMPFLELFRQSEFKEQNMTGYGHGVQAETFYEHDEIEEAAIELEMALQYGHRFEDPGLFIPMYILKSRIHIAKEKFLEAHSILDYAMGTTKEQHWLDMLRVMKAKCHLFEGNIPHAELELSKSTGLYHRQAKSEHPFWLLAQVRLLLAREELVEALKMSIRIKQKALQDQQVATVIEAGVLEAVCQMKLSDEQAALSALHGALKQGEIYRYKRTFLDEKRLKPLLRKYVKVRQKNSIRQEGGVSTAYANELLGEYTQKRILDKLNPREKEILGLLAEGCTNNEIAGRLKLSEGTVRVYLTNLYSKLGVNSRTKAVLIAMEEL